MAKKKVCVSFDWDHDRRYKHLLEAWDKNPRFGFVFADETPKEINSWNVSRIKAGLTTKIKSATYLLVIVGKQATKRHKDYKLIGDVNWMSWEINKAKELGKKLVAVKLDRSYDSPSALLNSGATWAWPFDQEYIIAALNRAAGRR